MANEVLHTGSCHCKAVTFTVLHSRNFDLSECNCSICYIKGFLGFTIPSTSLKTLTGKEHLAEYTFNTGTAKHWFCKTCGISPLTVPRSFPEGYNINFRCLQREHVGEVKVTKRDGQNWEEAMREIRREKGEEEEKKKGV